MCNFVCSVQSQGGLAASVCAEDGEVVGVQQSLPQLRFGLHEIHGKVVRLSPFLLLSHDEPKRIMGKPKYV